MATRRSLVRASSTTVPMIHLWFPQALLGKRTRSPGFIALTVAGLRVWCDRELALVPGRVRAPTRDGTGLSHDPGHALGAEHPCQKVDIEFLTARSHIVRTL